MFATIRNVNGIFEAHEVDEQLLAESTQHDDAGYVGDSLAVAQAEAGWLNDVEAQADAADAGKALLLVSPHTGMPLMLCA